MTAAVKLALVVLVMLGGFAWAGCGAAQHSSGCTTVIVVTTVDQNGNPSGVARRICS